MDRQAIFSALHQAIPELNEKGVHSLAVFGSVARGSYTMTSDLDILVNLVQPVSLFEFVRLKIFLEKITGCRVDLVTPDALRPEMKDQILREAVDVR